MAVVNKKSSSMQNTEEDSEEDKLAPSRLDYKIPGLASEIFRANFQMTKEVKKKKGVKQWIPSSNEYWFRLKCQLA